MCSRALGGLKAAPALAHLEDVVGTLAAEVVLTWQDDHWLGKHLQADGADELLLQALHEGSRTPQLGWDRRRKRRTAGAGRRGRRAGDAPSVFRRQDVSCYPDNIPLYVKGHVEPWQGEPAVGGA